MMKQIRCKSNSKRQQPQSQLLEEETKKMEQRLQILKNQMEQQKELRDDTMKSTGSRWKAAADNKPIRNYAKKILDDKKKIMLKTGFNKTQKLSVQTTLKKTDTQNSFNQSNLMPNIRQTPSMKSSRPSSSKSNQSNSKLNQSANIEKENIQSNNQDRIKSQAQQSNNIFQPLFQDKISDDKASFNLLKHLNLQRSTQAELNNFLQEVNLAQYKSIFLDNGFDDMETIAELNTELMNNMKIPAGHQIKISKAIQNYKQQHNQVTEEQQQQTPIKISNAKQQSKTKETVDKQDEGNFKVLIPRDRKEVVTDQETEIGDENQKSQKKEEEIGESKGGELLKGTFDEQESHNSFLEALMEFRQKNKKPTDGQQDQSVQLSKISEVDEKQQGQKPFSKQKSVRFDDTAVDNEGKSQYKKKFLNMEKAESEQMKAASQQKNEQNNSSSPAKKMFFFYSGDKEWTNQLADIEVETQTQNGKEQQQSKRQICWVCFKTINEKDETKQENEKIFCSEKCQMQYTKETYQQCQNPKCAKRMQKVDCLLKNGKWYCSDKCSLEHNAKPKNGGKHPAQKQLAAQPQKQVKNEKRANKEGEQDESGAKNEGEIDIFQNTDEQLTKSQVLSKVQLEIKYKVVNLEQQDKIRKSQMCQSQLSQQGEGDVFEDSLELTQSYQSEVPAITTSSKHQNGVKNTKGSNSFKK